MLIASLIVALVIWLLVSWLVKLMDSKPRGSDALIVLVFLLSSYLALSFMMSALVGALVYCMGLICLKRNVAGWRFLATTFAMVPLAGLIMSLFAWQHVQKLSHLQAKYPLVPITDRLGYEANAINSIPVTQSDQSSQKLDYDSAMLLREMDDQSEMWSDWRHRMLGELHQNQLDAFINSPGFGPLRGLPRVSEAVLERDPRPTITPPDPPEVPYEPGNGAPPGNADQGELVDLAAKDELSTLQKQSDQFVALKKDQLQSLHRESAVDFINAQGFGWVDSGRVAGFEPHSFSKLPEVSGTNQGGWVLTSLQLVSMLKHQTPVIYDTRELPRMEVLRSEDIPTRPLDAFEASALPKIRQGEMVVVEEATNRIRMLGAVRAGKTCIECHEVPRNTLLGAFSYELARSKPLPEGKTIIEKPEL